MAGLGIASTLAIEGRTEVILLEYRQTYASPILRARWPRDANPGIEFIALDPEAWLVDANLVADLVPLEVGDSVPGQALRRRGRGFCPIGSPSALELQNQPTFPL